MSLATVGAGLQGVGDAGNQIASGQLAAHRQRLADLLAELRLKEGQAGIEETQAQTRKLNAPTPTELDKQLQLRSAFKSLFGKDPTEADERLLFGLPPEPKKIDTQAVGAQIDRGLQAIPEEQRKLLEPTIRGWQAAGDTEKALQALTSVAEKYKGEPKPQDIVKGAGGKMVGMKIGEDFVLPGSPKWTKDMQAIMDAEDKAMIADQKEKEDRARRTQDAAMARMMKGLDLRQQNQLFTNYDKAKKTMRKWDHMTSVSQNADNYVKSPSGPGDVALMLAYVDASKPDAGFRFTKNEQVMIEKSRGLVGGAQAALARGEKGLLFGPAGSEQREGIGNIVKRAGELAEEQRSTYLKGISAINPDLYDILSNNTDDFTPDPDN